MPSSKSLLIFGSAALAAVIQRDHYVPDGQCCFTLADATTGKVVQQDKHSGFLYFDADLLSGWYCSNLSDGRDMLWDEFANACIISSNWPFQCLDGTPGPNRWRLTGGGGDSNSQRLLTHDGSQGFKACPNQQAGGGEIVRSDPSDAVGCRDIRLAAQDMKGKCA